jgi:hypothetical protein
MSRTETYTETVTMTPEEYTARALRFGQAAEQCRLAMLEAARCGDEERSIALARRWSNAAHFARVNRDRAINGTGRIGREERALFSALMLGGI